MTVREIQMWTDLGWPTAWQIDDYIFSLLGKLFPIVVVAEAYEKLPWRLIDDSIRQDVFYPALGYFEERKNFIINECYLRNKQREQEQSVSVGTVAVWTEQMARDWALFKRNWRDQLMPLPIFSFLEQLAPNEIIAVESSGAVQAGPPDVHRKIELEFI